MKTQHQINQDADINDEKQTTSEQQETIPFQMHLPISHIDHEETKNEPIIKQTSIWTHKRTQSSPGLHASSHKNQHNVQHTPKIIPTSPPSAGFWYYGLAARSFDSPSDRRTPRRKTAKEFVKHYPKPTLSISSNSLNDTKQYTNSCGSDTHDPYERNDSPALSSCAGSHEHYLSDDPFGLDDQSYLGHSADAKSRSYSKISAESFHKLSLNDAIEDLEQSPIIYHGLFKVYSFVINSFLDVAGILTSNKLYFASAIKYQRWEELRDRSNIDKVIKHIQMKVTSKLADELVKNMNVLEDNEEQSRLLSHFNGKTKNQIMLNMLLNKFSREEMRSLSSYLQLTEEKSQQNDANNDANSFKDSKMRPRVSKMDRTNSFKDIKYIEILGIDTICKNVRSEFLEDILANVGCTCIREQMIDESMIITLGEYHSSKVIMDMNKRKDDYFKKHKLENKLTISAYAGNQIKYSLTEIHFIDLFKYNDISVLNENSDSFELCIQPKNKNDKIFITTDSKNLLFEWNTHLDAMLHEIKQKQSFRRIPIHDSSFHDEENDDCYEEHKEAKENSSSSEHIINDFDDQMSEDDKKTEFSTNFNFGLYFNYWKTGYHNSVTPTMKTLKDELTMNDVSKISESNYYGLYADCVGIWNKTGFKIKSKAIGPNLLCHNDVPVGSPITINHLICLKLYTDFTNVQKAFKKQCRKYNDEESIEDFVNRNSKIAHWCRYLKEACSFYGSFLKKQVVYTGLNRKLLFSSLTQKFYCPISTTTCVGVANNFCEDHHGRHGVILKLKAANAKSYCIDVSWLSRHADENERLIMGAPMQICDIYIQSKSTRKYIRALQLLEDILNGFQINSIEKIEEELYKMICKLLAINTPQYTKKYQVPKYIEKLLNVQIDKLQDKMENKEPLKRLWINETAIKNMNCPELKCLFGCCSGGGKNCGSFFPSFGIVYKRDVNKALSFQWIIEKEQYERFKNNHARTYIESDRFEYRINSTEKIVFYMKCCAKYSNESRQCALYLHVEKDGTPKRVESIKVEYDLLYHIGTNNYHHIMTPQVLCINKEDIGCKVFPTSRLTNNNILIWNIGIKINEIKYHDECIGHMDDTIGQYSNSLSVNSMETFTKEELIQLIQSQNVYIQSLTNENENLKQENKTLKLERYVKQEQ